MPPQPETVNPEAPKEPAKTIAMPVPPTTAQTDLSGTEIKPKLGAISPPLAWPSPKIQEIAKWARPRVPAQDVEQPEAPRELDRPNAAVLPISRQAKSPAAPDQSNAIASFSDVGAAPIPSPEPSRPDRIAWRSKFIRHIREQRSALAEAWTKYGDRSAAMAASVTAGVKRFEQRAWGLYRAAQISRQIRRAEQLSAKHIEPAQQIPLNRAEQAAGGHHLQIMSLFAIAKRWANWISLRARTQTSTVAHAAQRASAFRIRVRLDKPQVAGFRPRWWATKGARPWLAARRLDSRLWTSMGMATLSALLAIAVITGVRRYGSDSTPSQVSASAPPAASSARPAALMSSRPTFSAQKRIAHNAAPAAVKTPSLPVTESSAASAADASPNSGSTAHPRKIHHSEDDDYVAKDTYVYYGPKGKPSH